MVFPEISFFFCIFTALLLLTVPLPWVGAAVAAGAVHELSHMLAIWLLGGNISRFTLGAGGARLYMEDLTPKREILAAAAGPLGSFLLLLFIRVFPRISLCGLIHGLFNLLPIYPMDGGRILYGILGLFLPEETVLKGLKLIKVLTLFGISAVSVFLKQPWGLILVIFLIFPMIRSKIPCKERP